MLIISGIFLFTSRDTGYLGNLIKGILPIWDMGYFPVYFQGYRISWYTPPPPYTSLPSGYATDFQPKENSVAPGPLFFLKPPDQYIQCFCFFA